MKRPRHNPVAKHAGRFNKSQTYRDRKKDERRGYTKHKEVRHEQADTNADQED